MDSKKDDLDGIAKKLREEIQNMDNYKSLYKEIQRLAASPAVKKEDFKKTLVDALKTKGLETEIKNTVFHWARSQGPLQPKIETPIGNADLSYLKKTQIQWERRIQKSLNSMCNELNVPLARVRPNSEREQLSDKWDELSTYDLDLSQYRPLYAPKDFLEVLFSIRDPAFKKQLNEPNWEFSHIQIRVKTLTDLRLLYDELAKGAPLSGVNPNMPAIGNFPNLDAERTHMGEKVLKSNHSPLAQEFLKRGSPIALRGRLWSLVLGSIVKENDIEYYKELRGLVIQYDIMVDKLIIKDVQLTAKNDDQYFVFEDMLYKTMLCFSRDSEVLAPVTTDRSAGGQVIHAVLQGKPATLENTLVFPPSGVIPFHGFTMYGSPFCYLYDDPCALYFTFRAFYLRYWFRLHTVSSHGQGIVALCLLFERLLQCHEPQLWAHLKNIHIHPTFAEGFTYIASKRNQSYTIVPEKAPIQAFCAWRMFSPLTLKCLTVKIVFKWLMRGFSGHLPPEQLLYLWDLILGYDSLEIIPLLAVTILSFRKENLMQVNTLQNVEAVLADLSSLKVMPLLQLVLLQE